MSYAGAVLASDKPVEGSSTTEAAGASCLTGVAAGASCLAVAAAGALRLAEAAAEICETDTEAAGVSALAFAFGALDLSLGFMLLTVIFLHLSYTSKTHVEPQTRHIVID